MKKVKYLIGLFLVCGILGFICPVKCYAQDIERKFPLNGTITGRVSMDQYDEDKEREQEDDGDGWWSPSYMLSHSFFYETDARLRLKYTIKISNIKTDDNISHPSIYLSDEYTEGALWNYEFSSNKDYTVEKTVTTRGNIYLNLGYADQYLWSFDYSITVQDVTSYSEKIEIPKSVNMKTGDEKKISCRNIYPSDAISTGVTWKSTNNGIATIDKSGKITAKKQGVCYVIATLKNHTTYSCKVQIINPKSYINYYKYTMAKGQKVKLKILYNNKKIKWSSSNKAIATVSSKGVVTAKKTGKCTVTGKIGKKKYKCQIVVVYRTPNFAAYLNGYNTRGNYFTVKYKNLSKKTVTILANDAKVMDIDYKSYDRNLNLSQNRSINIKPGKSITVRFYVRGRTTWYDYTDFTLSYKFKYDGKTYTGHTWYEESSYKKGKKWYKTYAPDYEDWYLGWIYK